MSSSIAYDTICQGVLMISFWDERDKYILGSQCGKKGYKYQYELLTPQ